MIITDIVPKRKRLSALYIDGEFALKIDSETLITSPFSVGSEITDEQLKELIDASGEKRAKEKALWLLSSRDHSKRELETKIRKTSDSESAKKAVERMEELGLVNDEKFARRYAEELINIKHLSLKGAKYKLLEKGIDRDLADEILEEMPFEPREHIELLIEKKYKKYLSDEKGRRKTIAALQRLGYSWSDINAVMNNYFEDEYI
ncbi:MAG: RecX family transcriptional regulator [Ruminococcus sp.]|nr:RecX family transcriptional regulator [Ruminococcus sp.]